MKANTDILKLIDEIDHEAFIIDNNGLILYSNILATQLLPANFSSNKFFDLFLHETNENIEKLLEETVSYNQNVKKRIIIKFFNGIIKECEVKVSKFTLEENNKVYLIIFHDKESGQTEKEQIKILLSNQQINEIIGNDGLLEVIEQIKANYPFTLIGKNNLQSEIDKLNNFFWMKDVQGKYLIVNQKFAHSLGLKPSQVEGHNEKEFLPNYLIEFAQSMAYFVENTSRTLIKKDFPFPYYSDNQSYQVVEFPLCDVDNKTIAVVGLTYCADDNTTNKSGAVFELALQSMSEPALILNSAADIETANKAFMELFPSLLKGEKNERLSKQLPEEIKEFVDKSIVENKDESEFEVKAGDNRAEQLSIVFNLRKLYNSGDELEGYLLTARENPTCILEKLKKDKGKMYEFIMQNSPEPMFVYDVENLKFLDVNQSALNMYGYSKDEFLQMDLTDLYSPEDIQTLLDKSDKELLNPKFTGPWRHKKKNGSAFFVEIAKYPFDYNNRKAHFNIIKDVTDKLELQKKIQLYQAVFDNSKDLLFLTDAEGFITYANDQVSAVLGYSNEELENRPFITLASDEDRIRINSEVFGENLKESLKLEVVLKNKNGDFIEAELIATPVIDYNNQIISFNIIVQPFVAETGIGSAVKTGKGTEPVNKGFVLDESFLSNVFHEILTPMNVILGFVQEISENIVNPSAEQKEAIEIINQNREVLLQTMDSLLEYSYIAQNKTQLKVEKFLFTDIVDNIQKNTQKTAKVNNKEFAYGKISSSLSIESDKRKIESLFSLIVTSAMKITKEKKVYVSAYQYDDDNYIISIRDSRKGVSKFLLDNFGDIFAMKDEELKRNFGISKLKLQLMNKLTELLKGRYETISKGDEVIEIGFIFPLEFSVDVPDKDKIVRKKQNPAVEKETETAILQKEQEIEEPEVFNEKSEKSEEVFEGPSIAKEEIEQPEIPTIPVIEEVKSPGIVIEKGRLDISKLKCLYVEDQVDSQILFKVQMKELKEIDFAVSFEAALPLLDSKKYDIVILDINLQGEYNGLDALRFIRKIPGYEMTKIIAVTAYLLPGDKEKFIAAGFNDFISKPIMREKLLDSFDRIMLMN